MSDQFISQTDTIGQTLKTQFTLGAKSDFALTQDQGAPPIFPWTKKLQLSKEEKVNQKVQEIRNKLKPEVSKISDEFIKKVVLLANEIKCEPEDLLAIMYQESTDWNPATKAVSENGTVYGGIIQMNADSLKIVVNKYAKELNLKKGISMREYLKLSREKQLDYAKGYFVMQKDSCNLDNKSHLTAGETWGMLKSPNQTKKRNQKFLKKLETRVENTKKKIFIQEIGQHLNIPKG